MDKISSDNIILIICAALSFIIIQSFILKQKKSRKSKRHHLRIKQATRIVETLNTFDGQYRIPQALVYLRKINPYAFEELLLNTFYTHGYKIKRNISYSGDGGIDGKVYDKQGNIYLIQAKRYSGLINRSHLVHFHHAILRQKAKGGFFIHTGKTSKICLSEYRNTNIKILSGTELVNFIVSPAKRYKHGRVATP